MKLDTIQNDLNKLYSQFISIDDLIGLLEEIQPNSNKESIIHWLIHKTELLEKTKYLLFVNDCEIVEYSPNNQFNLPSPIDVLHKLKETSFCISGYSEMVGFAKQRLLIELKANNLPITDEMIRASIPYLPLSVTKAESKEMSYISEVIKDIQNFKNDNIKIDSQGQNAWIEKLPPKLQATINAHHKINILGHYAGERSKAKKVKIFLEDHYPMYTNSFLNKVITTLINSTVDDLLAGEEIAKNDNKVAEEIRNLGFKEHFKKAKRLKVE